MSSADNSQISSRGSNPTLEESLDEALDAGRGAGPGRSPAGEKKAHLVVVQGPDRGRMFPIGQGELVFGRGDDVEGQLNEPSVSQRHAKVICHSGHHMVIDLGSTNGTFVNEERIDGPVQLEHSDSIRIGQTVLTYLVGGQGVANQTVPLGVRPTEPRRDYALVLRRDTSLATGYPNTLEEYAGRRYPTQGNPDWVFYVRSAVKYTKRYAAFALIMAGIGVAAGTAHAMLRPPSGSAFFEITLSREAKANPVEEERSVQFFVAAEKSFTSVSLIKRTLERLGMDASDGMALAVQRNMGFSALDRYLQVWRGEFEGWKAEEAKELLEKHLDVYLEHELDKNLHVLRAEIALLAEQLEKNSQRLHLTESTLASFKQEHPGAAAGGGAEHYASLTSLEARRDELSAQVKRLKLELNLNRQRLDSGDALLQGRVESASSYTKSITDVEKQITEAKAQGLGELHPKVRQLRAQLAELRSLQAGVIQTEASDIERRSNPAHVRIRERVRDLEVAVRVAETELGQVAARIDSARSVVTDLPGAEAELAKLTRNYSSTKALQDKLYQKVQASRLQLQMEQESARARYDLITPPTAVPPNMPLTIAKRGGIGGFALLFLALVVAVLREGYRYVRSVL